MKKVKIGMTRTGVCKHTTRLSKQVFDGVSNDAKDQKGWCCIHHYNKTRVEGK